MAKKKPAKPKKPKGTPNPPPGSYDPNLDSELGRSKRGLEDLLSDIGGGTGSDPLGIQRVRAQDDLGTALRRRSAGQCTRGLRLHDTATGNVETGYSATSPICSRRASRARRTTAPTSRASSATTRISGSRRRARSARRRVALGGAAEQARQKRAANEAIDRAPIDTAYSRFIDQSNLTQGRLGEDRSATSMSCSAAKRGDQDLTTQGEKMGLAFQRQDTDWATQVQRGKREAGAFAGDILNAKVAQFVANNPDANLPYTALPKPPKAPGMTLAPGRASPGTTLRKRKTKRGQTIGLYTNAVTAP
jgi:hypothetical protein